jgi:16S rRNA (adenine1518-N6/adenine1519-N6)-dimethyltransferase
MQSKQQICRLLESAGVRPDKRFGQHFLIDLNLMRLLIDTADIKKEDVVLEVGCATGSLTEAIAEKAGFCVAVEIDEILADIAKAQLADRSNIEIITADVLENKFTINPVVIEALNHACAQYTRHGEGADVTSKTTGSPGRSRKGRLLLVGNLPYSAATPLMLNLITGPAVVDAMFVTVQKEVANRMTASAGSKDYGIISILLSATGDVRNIRTLKPSVFWPQPRVDSAMISFTRNIEKINQIKNIETLGALVGGILRHRRKMLKSSCKLMTGELARRGGFERIENWLEIFNRCGINPNARPENLTPEQFVSLANLCCEL